MLQPQKVKYRKQQKGKRRGKATRGSKVSFGNFGIISTECGYITSRQIEACRIIIARRMRSKGKYWIRLFPDKPLTAKPLETRMGKGKGAPEKWVDVIKPGRVLFEITGVDYAEAKDIFKKVSYKLPLKTKTVARQGVVI